MSKKALVTYLSERTGVNKNDVSAIIDSLPEAMAIQLKSNGRSQLPGVCIATIKKRPERQGRNPKTGEAMVIAAREVVSLKPAATLKQLV